MDSKIIATNNDIVFYKKDNGDTNIELLINGETLWVIQKTMAEIFDIDRTVITKHLKNIFNDGESDKNQVCAKVGKTYNTEFYNLDAIISVVYRVNSKKAKVIRTRISHRQAIDKAHNEYEKYKIKQDEQYISSMDEMYKKYLEENK